VKDQVAVSNCFGFANEYFLLNGSKLQDVAGIMTEYEVARYGPVMKALGI